VRIVNAAPVGRIELTNVRVISHTAQKVLNGTSSRYLIETDTKPQPVG
jgi:hypothetical protein